MLKTEFLGLSYHANVESNTDEVDAEEYFNNNYKKIDANAKKANEDLVKLKEDLEQENTELSNNMPWNTIQGKSIHITDSAKYSKNRLSISGDMEQEKRSGYNLFNINDKKTVDSLITVDKDDWISATYDNTSGTSVKYVNYKTHASKKIKANTNYALFLEVKSVSGTGTVYPVSKGTTGEFSQFTVSTGTVFSNLSNNKIYKYTITSIADLTPNDVITMIRSFVRFDPGQSGSITFRISVLEDTSVTTDNFKYEKYGAMPSTEFSSMPLIVTGVQKIRQFGKNFIPYPYADSTMTARGINYVSNSNGSISISGTSNSNIADFYLFGNSTDNGNYLHLRQNTYSLKDTGNTNIIYIAREKTLGVLIGINTILQALKTQDCYFYGFFVRVNNGATVNTIVYPQLELGNTSTDYEPYSGTEDTLDLKNTQLCAIKDINGNIVAKDRHVFRNGKWQWEKKIKKFVLKGTENWSKSGNTANISYFLVSAEINDVDTSTISAWASKVVANAISNYFTTVSPTQFFTDKEAFCFDVASNGNNEMRLGFGLNTDLTTVALLKEWLAQKYAEGNPVVIYYILKNPIYEDCTAGQSTVLDKLYNNFKLGKGVNNVIVESENGVGVNMELTYMQDNILKDKKLEDRVTALENLLSTTQTSALLLDNLQSDLESEV